jgi:hypothetical protein
VGKPIFDRRGSTKEKQNGPAGQAGPLSINA